MQVQLSQNEYTLQLQLAQEHSTMDLQALQALEVAEMERHQQSIASPAEALSLKYWVVQRCESCSRGSSGLMVRPPASSKDRK